MRKRTVLLLLAAVMLLCACHTHKENDTPEHPFAFYYAKTSVAYGTEESVICPEQREFDTQTQTPEALLKAYFEGPESARLTLPFPEDMQAFIEQADASSVTVSVSEAYLRLSGINKSIADACLAKTFFGYGFERVILLTPDGTMTTLTPEKLVLYDTGAQVQDTSVTLYFADAESRFLMAEQRSTEPLEEAAIPAYIINQLIAGTTQRGYGRTIPFGTRLLDIKVEDGLCTVDFSPEFLTNSPENHSRERVTVYSVVNSLTELESISSVRILVDGETVEFYSRMSLADPLSRDTTMIGPVKAISGEISATLCVYDGNQLLPIPLILPAPENGNEAEAILQALIRFSPYNVYQNLLPGDTAVRSAVVEGTVCRVDLGGDGLMTMEAERQQLALRSVVATLCMSGMADTVLLTVDGESPSAEFERSVSPAEDWIAE